MTRFLLAAALLVIAAPAGAERTVVYKVKNADGTTSYSQDPVAGAEVRIVGSGGSRAANQPPPAPTPVPDQVKAGGEDAAAAATEACANATANLAVYDSGTTVTIAQGSGEPLTLTGAELAAARARAQRAVDAYCKRAAGT